MKKRNRLLIITLFLILSGPSLWPAFDLFGYYENRFFLLNHTDINWNNLKEKFQLADYNRLRLKYQASPSKKVTVNIALDLFSFHGLMASPLGTYDGTDESTTPANDKVKIDLDRAYVDLYFKGVDISIGKQRIAMGVSYLWAPLDLFNRINILEPKEEKPGANAFRVYIPLGTSSSLTGVFSPDKNFSSSKSGIRAQTQLLNIDMALTLIRSGLAATSVYGLDFRGENLIGWWLEAGYFVSPGKKDKKIVLGFDYTFPLKRGLYWLNEFFYDTSGAKDSADYDYQALAAGERFTLGRKYFFSMLRYGFSDFLSAAVSYIGNWGDRSFILNPTLQYEITQDISISSGFYFPLGKRNGEFNRNKTEIFFIWLKVNF